MNLWDVEVSEGQRVTVEIEGKVVSYVQGALHLSLGETEGRAVSITVNMRKASALRVHAPTPADLPVGSFWRDDQGDVYVKARNDAWIMIRDDRRPRTGIIMYHDVVIASNGGKHIENLTEE